LTVEGGWDRRASEVVKIVYSAKNFKPNETVWQRNRRRRMHW
jgi:hypothetical protein